MKTSPKNEAYNFWAEEYSGTENYISDSKTESLMVKCLKGNCKVTFKSYEEEIHEGDNFFVPQFIVFDMSQFSDDFHCHIIHLPDDFMLNVYPYLSSDFKTVLSMATPETYRYCHVSLLDSCFEQLRILSEYKQALYRNRVAVNIVTNYLLMSYDQLKTNKNPISRPPKNRSFEYANRFFKLLGDESVQRQTVDYYADKLNISARYLYRICQENTGLSPKQLIDLQIIGNIKKMLLSTDLSIQQIADIMGFPDQASLGQFFKRNEGVAPQMFRKSFK